MANPPQAGKMAPERPFPALFETGKSYPKTGLLPAVRRRFAGRALPLDQARSGSAEMPELAPRLPQLPQPRRW